jgi:hypothetical protein
MQSNDQLFPTIHSLAMAQLDGTITPQQHHELESRLLESADARQAYIEYIEESVCLRWHCVERLPEMVELGARDGNELLEKRPRRLRVTTAYGAGLACLLAAAVGAWSFFHGASPIQDVAALGPEVASGTDNVQPIDQPGSGQPAAIDNKTVATITGLESVRWSNSVNRARLLARCSIGDRLLMLSGAVQLTFDAGVQVTVFAPADFEITSPMSIRCARGRVTTLVGERGKGFTIQTPQAKVVDLGTQFGLSISDDGETEVVVFQGSVDLSYSREAVAGDATIRRMQQGDALLVKNTGELERVFAVERNNFLDALDSVRRRPVEPVIGDVRDNIRTDQSVKSYQIVRAGLEEDAPCFVDRNHQWNGVDAKGLPEFLVGADYIMPFNDDKFVRGLEIDVRLLRPGTLYVFLDNNMEVPDWLREGFEDTGVDIGMDGSKTPWHQEQTLSLGPGRSIDCRFSVWKREERVAGTITLGGIEPPEVRSQGFNMYGIAAVAKD